MTRSNDPFEDLPEWKERRRLREAPDMRQHGLHEAGGYPDSHAPEGAYPPARSDDPPAYDYGRSGEVPQWDQQPAQPTYDLASGAHNPHHQGYEQHGYDQPGYGQGFEEAAPASRLDAYPAESVGWAPSVDQQNPALSHHGFRDGHYDEPQFAPPLPSAATASLDDHRRESGPTAEPRFGAPPPFIGAGDGAGEGARYQPAGYGEADDEAYDDEYDYDDEDEDDEKARGYGWKMIAGLVVAGGVIAGGGFFLYDTLAGGDAGGPAPIIKAERAPAKTAPAEPGGQLFANQDSKLLGRLDSANTTTRTALDDDGRNRVREVPTVRVSPDGRLILPQASATSTEDSESGGGTSIPGINIVDNLSGSRSSFGRQGLPPVVPKTVEPQGGLLPSAAAAAPARQPASSSAQPIIRNRAVVSPSGNLATARSTTPPPLPQKSTIPTAQRTTGERTIGVSSLSAPTRSAAVPTGTTSTTTGSTMGASSVARQAGRQYVAVIATKSSRMAALESFAELQQRHPATLSNRVPSVQKADLSARGLGTMYRLLVGPAGSRQTANEVCASLKVSGYSGCWVKAH